MKTALAFSGGKDSWACLWLNKDRLDDIIVVWVDTGKNYPEMLETIEKAKAICPNFVTVFTDRAGQNVAHGIPSDVVPINWTTGGQIIEGEKSILIQSYLQCCFENISKPIFDFCHANGVTHLIHGQRNEEGHKSPARNGDIVAGITRIHPIEDWSRQQVVDFVALHMPLPEHFKFNHSSMDCYDCTAFSAQSKDRVSFTKAMHPDLYQEYEVRKIAINEALHQSIKDML
jgi:phosphoadenosine phosphosulfate reductase